MELVERADHYCDGSHCHRQAAHVLRTGAVAAVGAAGEYARPVLHLVAFVLHIVAVVAQVFRRTETFGTDTTWNSNHLRKKKIFFD